jgi:hypothetical protein
MESGTEKDSGEGGAVELCKDGLRVAYHGLALDSVPASCGNREIETVHCFMIGPSFEKALLVTESAPQSPSRNAKGADRHGYSICWPSFLEPRIINFSLQKEGRIRLFKRCYGVQDFFFLQKKPGKKK